MSLPRAFQATWRWIRAAVARPGPAPLQLQQLPDGSLDPSRVFQASLIDLLLDRRAERRTRLLRAALYVFMFTAPAFMYAAFYAWSAGMRFGPSTEVVGLVRLDGEMVDGSLASASQVIPALRKAFESSRVKAVVLSIDSPGGAPLEAERIYTAIETLRKQHPKPVVAVINNLGASAAYMVALHADRIYAGKYSLVGSIGAVLSGWDAHQALGRLGIAQRVYASGELKAMMNPYVAMTPEGERKARELVSEIGLAFKADLELQRKGKLAPGVDFASGGVWGGVEAHRLGLVDEVSTIDLLVATAWPGLAVHDFGPRPSALPFAASASSWLRQVVQGMQPNPPPMALR